MHGKSPELSPSRARELFFLTVIALGMLSTGCENHGYYIPDGQKPELSEQLNSEKQDTFLKVELGILSTNYYNIVQQPPGQEEYVDPNYDVITEFSELSEEEEKQARWFLAHIQGKAGQEIAQLRQGMRIRFEMEGGEVQEYEIAGVVRYQATEPNSSTAPLIEVNENLETIGIPLSNRAVKRGLFGLANGGIILQTCIENGGNSSWGRIFVVAQPLE